MPEDEIEDVAITGFASDNVTEEEEIPTPIFTQTQPDEPTQSGYCEVCRNRYTGAPVINGSVKCPFCNTK